MLFQIQIKKDKPVLMECAHEDRFPKIIIKFVLMEYLFNAYSLKFLASCVTRGDKNC